MKHLFILILLATVASARGATMANSFTTNATPVSVVVTNAGSNTPAITGRGIATFGSSGAFSIGTNFAGGEGPYIQIDAGKLTNNAEFLADGQMGVMFVSNGVVLGYFDIVAGHGGSANGAEMGMVTPGNIHLKATSDSGPFLANVGVCLIEAGSVGGRTVIGSTVGGKNGESQVLQFQTQGSTTSVTGGNYEGQTPTIWALTNGAGVATLQFYNPAPTWDGVNSNWTGGIVQFAFNTNYTYLASSNTWIKSREVLFGASDAMHFFDDSKLLLLGDNGSHSMKFDVQDGANGDIAGFGAGSALSPDGNYITRYGFAIGRTGVALQAGLSSSGVASNAFETYGNATVTSNLYALGLSVGNFGLATLTNVVVTNVTLDFPATTTLTASDLQVAFQNVKSNDVLTINAPYLSQTNAGFYTAFFSNTTAYARFSNYKGTTVDPPSGSFVLKVEQYK